MKINQHPNKNVPEPVLGSFFFSFRMRYHRILVFLFLFPLFGYAQDWDRRLADLGFVDVCTLDPTIQVHLVYATPHNFMKQTVYKGITKAWLHPDAAKKLVKAQQNLKKEYPAYSLLVYDAARPLSVQRVMWKTVQGTKNVYYVANPSKKSGRHNYGMAVDVTIVDADGKPLPMGTSFDFFGEEANTDNEAALVKTGKITEKDLKNRQLLRMVMRQAGFTTIKSEWWHFNACSGNTAKTSYKLIE